MILKMERAASLFAVAVVVDQHSRRSEPLGQIGVVKALVIHIVEGDVGIEMV
jgi:hypothetical protein